MTTKLLIEIDRGEGTPHDECGTCRWANGGTCRHSAFMKPSTNLRGWWVFAEKPADKRFPGCLAAEAEAFDHSMSVNKEMHA